MFPKEAAEYIYSKKAFRSNLMSFLFGWSVISVQAIGSATVALGFGGYMYAVTGINPIFSGVMIVVILSLLNFYGIKESAKANIIFTIIEVSGLLLIIFLGARFIGDVNYFESPTGFSGIFSAAILVFFAYLGFEEIAKVSEETKNPKKTIPRAILISTAISTVIYILVALISVSVVGYKQLGLSTSPLADVAGAILPGSSTLLTFIALFSTMNTVLVMLIVGSRMIFGLSKERSLPGIFSRVHPDRRTPHMAIFTVAVSTIVLILIGNIKFVAEATDFLAFFIFLIVDLSLIALRYREPTREKIQGPTKHW